MVIIIAKVIVRVTEITNKNIHIYIYITNWDKLILQIGGDSLLQLGTSVVTNHCSYNKLGQPLLKIGKLLQIREKCITNWGRYDKLGKLLHIWV